MLIRSARYAALAAVLFAPSVLAQEQQPGVFGAIGRFIDDSIAKVTTTLKPAPIPDPLELGKTGERAVTVAKETVGAVARLPNTSIVIDRERCPMAPNGTPDCVAGTEQLCKRK